MRLRDWSISIYRDSSERLSGMVGILLPASRQRTFQNSTGGPPRGPASRVVMGTVSHKENPEMTVSKSKAKKRCLFASQVEKFAHCLSCNWRMFAKVRGTLSAPGRKVGVPVFFCLHKLWMNYLLQQHGSNVSHITQKGIINLEKLNRKEPVSLTNSQLQIESLSVSNTFSDPFPVISQASLHLEKNLSWPINTFSSVFLYYYPQCWALYFSVLSRYNSHTPLYKFKVYSIMVWLTYVLKWSRNKFR